MHIIITDSKHTRVRSFQLNLLQLLLMGVGTLALVLSTVLAWWPASRHELEPQSQGLNSPSSAALERLLKNAASAVGDDQTAGASSLAQQNIDALAKRLGVMQARMIQLDALSARLAQLAGLPDEEVKPAVAGEGGALVEPRSMSAQEFSGALDALTQSGEEQLAWLSVIEDSLMRQEWADALTPGRMPVEGLHIGSRFGRRIDPITGKLATHTGVDFPGAQGTPVKASAGGVVVSANWHAGYGRLVEIEHGNGVLTRYAHLKAFKVAKGDVVKPGQIIGLLGNSGRSTGPHLHFEVWVAGRVRNPSKYLRDHTRLARAP